MAAQTIKKIFRFYLDGFRSMTVGKTLWAIILVKLFILLLSAFRFGRKILFSRFPGRAEPRRAQPFGHERTNPRQITIAYVI